MSGPTAGGETVHATLVAKGGLGVLLRGPAGAGKSDLALRLIASADGWRLVSDDQVALTRTGSLIVGRAPEAIAGKLEARGIGILDFPVAESAEIRLVIDLVRRPEVPRLPEDDETTPLLGLALPRSRLHGFDASTPVKIALLLRRHDKI